MRGAARSASFSSSSSSAFFLLVPHMNQPHLAASPRLREVLDSAESGAIREGNKGGPVLLPSFLFPFYPSICQTPMCQALAWALGILRWILHSPYSQGACSFRRH